ncbi:uncharacterized protein LACBIDRAFT_315623 [Laccaria bicolor S238N-H82]|uniref:Predicted protein n=1 Tax=Laccaria bicolor (strain S238N-H82 / ATCC MYA-4686) TaxID=486041 RepID=B0D2S9_LACBS|nr:uncharacterized protein LACBIDRAFT_315623 [Laccaria bicolor S238N-H82]EDR11148.1 predicted protein [Laccaria bicolor S238N-H82]|eukprot:XP_001878449.1 predicted protein [Laccaria bicolor S238N-H82]
MKRHLQVAWRRRDARFERWRKYSNWTQQLRLKKLLQAAQTLDKRVAPLFVELERIKKDNEIMRDALKEAKIDLEVTELLQRHVDELSQLLHEAQKSLASEKEENNRLVTASRRQADQRTLEFESSRILGFNRDVFW